MKLNKKKGFTIIELVIVIAVIGVLTAVLVPVFINLTMKANEASDQSLVKNLNTVLAMAEQEEGYTKSENPSDMFKVLEKKGYIGETLLRNQKSEKKILYSLPKNRFLFEEKKTDPEFTGSKAEDFWAFGVTPDTTGYSSYLYENFTPANGDLVVDSGLDTGKNDEAFSIKYLRAAGNRKEVVIYTSNANISLTVQAPSDVVKHFGDVGSLNIIAVAPDSYHEFGKAAFAEINFGRIVLENKSTIKHIHVNANEAGTGFEEVIIKDNGAEELPQAITRDEITLESGSVDVVTVVSNAGEEVVKVYADGTTGSTQKTETQNTTVESALGQLVLDNGADPEDKKALNDEVKDEVKEEVIDELASEEVADDPNLEKYSVRIGAKGYERFIDAVNAAKPGEKIVAVASTIVVDANIGSNATNGLTNKVVINADTTLLFKNTASIYMSDDAGFILNGNKLNLVADSSCNTSTLYGTGFRNCDLFTAYHGLYEAFYDYYYVGNTATILVDFNGDEDSGVGFNYTIYNDFAYGTTPTWPYGLVGGEAGSIDNLPYDESGASVVTTNGDTVNYSNRSVWLRETYVARLYLPQGEEGYTFEWSSANSEKVEIVSGGNGPIAVVRCNVNEYMHTYQVTGTMRNADGDIVKQCVWTIWTKEVQNIPNPGFPGSGPIPTPPGGNGGEPNPEW